MFILWVKEKSSSREKKRDETQSLSEEKADSPASFMEKKKIWR